MLLPRIIPSLLIHNKGLVKTVNFKNPKYVGDPLNAVKIFNEKLVDELIITDIDATVNHLEPNYSLIEKIAIECRMPLSYGGGIKSIEHAEKVLSLGVEKIAISSVAVEKPSIVYDLAKLIGSQSVVVVLDVKKNLFSNKYDVYTHNGKNKIGINPIDYIEQMNDCGAGEIVINCIDKDGLMNDYDYNIIDQIMTVTDLPLTALGGAGSVTHISNLINRYKIIGAAAGSLFVFKGKYKAVLINYPNTEEKKNLLNLLD